MSLKLKAFGLALVAALAMSAVSVFSASATNGGHFTSAALDGHTILDISQTATHNLEFSNGTEIVNCLGQATYSGTLTQATTTEVTVTPTYGTCTTTGSNVAVTITGFAANECNFVFTVNTNPSVNESTAHLECAAGKFVTLDFRSAHHGGILLCTIKFQAQTPTNGGVTYTNQGVPSEHEITVHANAQEIHYDTSGLCGTKATNTNGTLFGSVTVKGTNTAGAPLAITAT